MKLTIPFLLFACSINPLAGQEDSLHGTPDSAVIPDLFNTDATYAHHIQSVTIAPVNATTSFPVISLTGGRIRLSFDDLSNDYEEYSYQIVHCDKDWVPTSKEVNDYYQQPVSNIIREYAFSTDTKVGFTHYHLDLPGDGERFLKSGNFLIHVFENETDKRKLTARFVVTDALVSVSGNVTRTDDSQYGDYLQQIKFKIHDPRNEIKDVGRIYARIHKNNSWDISCDDMRPSFVMDNVITFDRTDKCYFSGGNEYRQFNMIDYRTISNNIVRVNHSGAGPSKIWLDDDKPRSFLRYASNIDRNGTRQFTGDYKSFDPAGLDYAEVTFSLKTDDAMLGYELYVFGQLCNYRFEERCRMVYHADKQKYEVTLLLKQGLYDYQYVVRSPYQELPEEGLVEGSHAITENEYIVLVYYQSPFAGYDQLVGMERINSRVKSESLHKNN